MSNYAAGGRDVENVSVNESNFIIEALNNGQRIDGRGPYDFRTLKITFGSDYGQVQVQLGRTRVYVVTSCEVAEPYQDRPTEGFFTFNVQFSPMAAPEFDGGRMSIFGIELGRVVERGLRESRAIDTEALCIVAGSQVWSIRLDIHVLDHVGNLIDCCSIGAITALHHFRRPDVTIGEKVIIHPIEERDPVPLSIHHIPLCVTFGIFLVNGVSFMIVDPQWKEEMVMKGRMTIILNIHRELCGVQKAGGIPLRMPQILEAAKIAMVKVKELTAVIKDALKKDLVSRGKDISLDFGDRLMTMGIGTRQEIDGSVKFCDGIKSVSVQKENIDNHVPPTFAYEEATKDFAEFINELGSSTKSSNTNGQNMEEGTGEGEDEGEDEEDEGVEESLLVDEFIKKEKT